MFDSQVLWADSIVLGMGHDDVRELCLELEFPLALDGRLKECVGHSINDDIEAMIIVIARVMDVWLYCHSDSRAVFSGCLSDLGLGTWKTSPLTQMIITLL